jgi:HEPN domain-containing protein
MLQRFKGGAMPESYAQAAVRHFNDAEHLASNGRLDNAGYLIGYAVECTVKDVIVIARPGEDAPHVHLPDLAERAKKALKGRGRQTVFNLLDGDRFMAGWMVDLRYGADTVITQAVYDGWKRDAKRILGAAGLKRRTK